jgi:hypothetical protein
MRAAAYRCLGPESVPFAGLGCGGLPPLSRGHPGRANEGSAKNPPKGKFVEGVFYVAAKAATHKATPGPAVPFAKRL